MLNISLVQAEYYASNRTSNTLILQSQASRFLAQASMGGTVEEIETLADRIRQIGSLPAFEEWIDQQFEIPRSTTLEDQTSSMMVSDGVAYNGNASVDHWQLAWWSQAINSEDQLRHKMAFALSQIFVVSMNYWNGLYRSRYLNTVAYYDMLMDNAFTNHRALLHDVTYSPMMGVWLSHAQNFGDASLDIFPDENYAREILQLFSMGVFALNEWGDTLTDASGNPIENYDNTDIREFSEVFTGLSINDQRGYLNKNLTLLGSGPLTMVEEYHDQSSKILLNGTVLPAGQDGDTDIAMSLDNIAEHSSTAPYMSRLLIQRFTHSSPSREYIKRVSDAWNGTGPYGTGIVGDFKAVLKAILLDTSVRDSVSYVKEPTRNQFVTRINTDQVWRGKIKEPILKMSQFYRFANPVSSAADGHQRIGDTDRAVGQEILWASTVFNFYDASHLPSDGPIGTYQAENEEELENLVTLAAPEAQILGQNVVREFAQFYDLPLENGPADYGTTTTTLNTITELKENSSTNWVLIRHLDVMLCHGQLPYELATALADHLGQSEDSYDERFAQIVSVLFSSPACSVIM